MLTSDAVPGTAQADGLVPITETHTTEDGRVFKYQYLSTGFPDPEHVKEARAAIIEAELASRAAALLMVVGTEVPITKHDLISRFTADEYAGIEELAKTDNIIKFFMLRLHSSGIVHMKYARQGFAYLEYIGFITPERERMLGGG